MKKFDYIIGFFLALGGIWLIYYFNNNGIWSVIGLIISGLGFYQLYITYKSD